MNLPKLNEALIRKTLKHIKDFPESYDQDTVASECEITKKTPCGAIGCFGVWMVLLSKPKKERQAFAESVDLDAARDLAGLTEEEADFLFDTTGSGDSKKDYKTIVKRLEHIRAQRKAIELRTSSREFSPLDYSDYLG